MKKMLFGAVIGGHMVERANDAGNDIVDEGEVAPYIAVIEQPERAAGAGTGAGAGAGGATGSGAAATGSSAAR